VTQKDTTKSLFEATEKANVSLVIVYDNYTANRELKTGWGFSCFIKTEAVSILFDSSADSEALLSNMQKLKIDPKHIDFVFISHMHTDHTRDLSGILKIKPDIKVYKPEFFSGPSQIIDGIWTTGPMGQGIK